MKFEAKASKELSKLDRVAQDRVRNAIDALADNPFPNGAIHVQNTADSYRIRVGDYRVLYNVDGEILVVFIVRVGHRREVYKR